MTLKRQLALSAYATAVLSLIAPAAQAAPTHFHGAMVIVAKAGTCADYDPTGEELQVRFRPANVGANGPDTGFTFLWSNGGYGATVPGPITAAYKTATITSLFDFGFTGGTEQVRFTSQAPPTITVTTPSVNVTGNLTDFDGMPGCTVTFRMTAVQRIN